MNDRECAITTALIFAGAVIALFIGFAVKVRELDSRVKELERDRTATAYWLPNDPIRNYPGKLRYVPGVNMDERDAQMKRLPLGFRYVCDDGTTRDPPEQCPKGLDTGAYLDDTAKNKTPYWKPQR